MADLTILCLAFRTPPAVRPQAILIGKMIPEWIRQGIRPIIATYDDNGDWEIGAPVIKIPAFVLKGRIQNLPVIRDILEFAYCKKIVKRLRPLIRQYGVQTVFSFANPTISNIVGAMLCKKEKTPFVSHFSDPWHDQQLERCSWIQKLRSFLQERFVIRASTAIIFVNPILRTLVMKKYPPEWLSKTHIIPHCFDPSAYPAAAPEKHPVFTIAHLGAFYPKRSPEILFKCAASLKRNGFLFRLLLVGPEISYGGYTKAMLDHAVREHEIHSVVDRMEPVAYKESLKIMQAVQLLVAIDADVPKSPFLPSKLIDYAGSGTPIIGITPSGSPTDAFLQNIGYPSFTHKDADAITAYITKMINEAMALKPDMQNLRAYHVAETTKKLIVIFHRAINAHSL